MKTKYDLTTGGILQKLFLVAVPIMGTQLMQMTYNLVDMFWLGRVGSDAVASSGTAGLFMWLSVGVMLIGRMGAEIGVSQSLGRSDKESALQYTRNAVFIAAVLGVAFALILILFNRPLVGFFRIKEQNVVVDAQLYLIIVACAVPTTYITSAIVGAFNASGNSQTPFLLNVCGLVLNVILDPVLIFVFDMGVAGAALATAISQFAVCVLLVVAIKRHANRPFERFTFCAAPQMDKIRQIFKWSIPIGLESMLFTVLAMATSRFEAAFGAYAIAMSRVGSQIESLSWLVGGGYGSALTSFVGQNYGANKRERIVKGVRISSYVMAVWGAIVTAVLALAGGFIFSLFLPDSAIVRIAVPYLRIMAICQIPMCLETIAAGAFKGSGRTIQPAVASITCNFIRVPLAYVLSKTNLGLYGIYWAISMSTVLRGVWIYLWYTVSERRHTLENA